MDDTLGGFDPLRRARPVRGDGDPRGVGGGVGGVGGDASASTRRGASRSPRAAAAAAGGESLEPAPADAEAAPGLLAGGSSFAGGSRASSRDRRSRRSASTLGVLEWWMSLHLSTISAASAARSVEALRVLTLIFFDPSLFSVITVTPSGA